MNKWFNRAGIAFQYVYESRIAPFFAQYLWVFWWPLYLWCKKNDIFFVVNIAEGTGQVLPELDNFFHMLKLREVDPRKKYVWIRTRNDFSKALIPLYRHKFYYAAMSTVLYDLLLPILLRWHDVSHDAGMAGLHWQLPQHGSWQYPKPWQTYLYVDTKEEVLTRWRNWYERRSQNPQFYPLQVHAIKPLALSLELQDFIGRDTEKIALVHIKENVMNATAKVTDPATYIPALEHLQAQGYKVVFVGREKMPEVFKRFAILDYANSSLASFLHDLQLFAQASLAITGGSGIAWIADTVGTPILYLNSWHLFMPPWSPKCVYVPTLVQEKESKKLLSFKEQFDLYTNTDFTKGDVFPFEKYEPLNASAEDILQGLYELESVMQLQIPLSVSQQSFKQLHPQGWTMHAQSRVSNKFLQRYSDILLR